MKDTAKTKMQLVVELEELRQQQAVEQAAERLREHVLAMRTSEDLYSVAASFLAEVRHLGIDTLFLSIVVFADGKMVHHYPVTFSYTPMGLTLRNENDPWIKMSTNEALIRYMPPDQFDQMPEQWKELMKQGEVEKTRAFQTKSVLKIRAYIDADSYIRNDWTGPENNLKQAIAHASGEFTRIHIPFSQGVVSFSSRTDDDQQVETVTFLAEAFSLGYTRFLDLKQLEHQNRELEQANTQIQQATQRKSQFLASMSHELRTPMNAIKGFTNLVLRRRSENLNERQRENLEKVTQASDHLLAMINDLLDLSKIEAGHMDVNPESFSVQNLVTYCCATVSPLVEEKPDVSLEYEVSEGVEKANTDQGRLRQMLINLLSNAIKFTDSGSVTVKAGQEEGQLVISVADTGKGIPEDEIDSIFDEYRQVKGSDREHKGTGLGLSITKKFAELLGGSIHVQSEVGKGSIFVVRIPMVYKVN